MSTSGGHSNFQLMENANWSCQLIFVSHATNRNVMDTVSSHSFASILRHSSTLGRHRLPILSGLPSPPPPNWDAGRRKRRKRGTTSSSMEILSRFFQFDLIKSQVANLPMGQAVAKLGTVPWRVAALDRLPTRFVPVTRIFQLTVGTGQHPDTWNTNPADYLQSSSKRFNLT